MVKITVGDERTYTVYLFLYISFVHEVRGKESLGIIPVRILDDPVLSGRIQGHRSISHLAVTRDLSGGGREEMAPDGKAPKDGVLGC